MKYSGLLMSLTLALGACSHAEHDPVQGYLNLAPAEFEAGNNKRIQAFIKLYDQLDSGDPSKLIAEAYAEKIYFNDTLVTIFDRESLLRYLKHTQKRLDSIEARVLSVHEKGRDVYVRWQMRTRFSTWGQAHDIESVGISHLRFNDEGRIILHQDYWDSTQGLFQHLPIIGGILRWIKSGLEDY